MGEAFRLNSELDSFKRRQTNQYYNNTERVMVFGQTKRANESEVACLLSDIPYKRLKGAHESEGAKRLNDNMRPLGRYDSEAFRLSALDNIQYNMR